MMFVVTAFHARVYAGEPMTIRDCMEYAISNSTKMRIQAADRSDEQVARRDAILRAFTPAVSGGSSFSGNFGRSIDPETNTYISTRSVSNGYSASASLTLFDGFSAVNNLRISATNAKMGASKERQAEDEICLATIEAFCNTIYYTELCDIVEAQVATLEESLHRVQRQEELGQKGHADVVQVESELASKQYSLISTRNLKDNALMTLKDVMFYPVEDELEIDREIEAGLRTMLAFNAEDIAAFAREYDPSIIIARGNMDNARRNLSTARWHLAPSLSLSGGVSTSYFNYPGSADYHAQPFRAQLKNNLGEYFGLSLNIPIYSRLSSHSQISRMKNAYDRASAEYDQKQRDIENEVYRAVNDRNGAESAFRQAEKFADVQEEAYNLSRRQFELGLISGIEFKTASGSYLEAMATSLDARLKYCIKNAVVRHYNGESYIDQWTDL